MRRCSTSATGGHARARGAARIRVSCPNRHLPAVSSEYVHTGHGLHRARRGRGGGRSLPIKQRRGERREVSSLVPGWATVAGPGAVLLVCRVAGRRCLNMNLRAAPMCREARW